VAAALLMLSFDALTLTVITYNEARKISMVKQAISGLAWH
jgi:hypothetical protein